MLDMITVNETSNSDLIPTDDDGINGLKQSMEEAVRVNNNFQAQALSWSSILLDD